MTEDLDKFIAGLDAIEGKAALGSLEMVANWLDAKAATELTGFPDKRDRLIKAICRAFHLTPQQLEKELEKGHCHVALQYKDDFMPLVPSEGLLRDYVNYTLNTESPTSFHAFSFLTILGAMLGRQCCIQQHVFQIWPNMVTILVGPSGIAKTTAAEFSIKLARTADGAMDPLGVIEGRFDEVAEKATSEAIHTALADKDPAIGFLYAGELTTFLNKKDYNKTLIKDLTRLWDCPDYIIVRTQARSKEVLRNVALSFLGCSTVDWLLELPEDALTGGFMARVLQIYQPATDRVFPDPKPLDKALAENLVFGLVESKICHGEVSRTRDATKYYHKRYYEIKKTLGDHEARVQPFYSRMPHHMLRLAMLLSICEARVESVFITDEHIHQAEQMLLWIFKGLPKIYSAIGSTNIGTDSRKILDILRKNGGRIAQHKLVDAMSRRLTGRQLDERLDTLQRARKIRKVSGGLFESQHQTVYYKLLGQQDE